MALEPRLSSLTLTAHRHAAQTILCPECEGGQWEDATNGDGSALLVCRGCGYTSPVGRWYTDRALGPRVWSTWSSYATR